LHESRNRPSDDARRKISLVVPVYNEEEAIEPFLTAIDRIVVPLDVDFDVVFVDDGSRDTTCDEIRRAATSRSLSIRLIALSRNFGKEAALTAGIDAASGDAVIPIDVDLQDPPELIPRFIEEWRKGYKVVYGRRIDRTEDSQVKRTTSAVFYLAFNSISNSWIPVNAGDFRLIDREVVDALATYHERTRFMKGLFSTVGFKTTHIDYRRPARQVGSSKWNYWKLWNFALDGIFSFSTVPLRLWTYVGAFIASVSFLYALFTVAKTLIFGLDVPGYASLITVVLFMAGVQLISLGIIGEYVARIFVETKQRPIYTIDQSRSLGFEGARPRSSGPRFSGSSGDHCVASGRHENGGSQ
jgi:glycosyltransferase involved in cell wall biosynthesis